MYSGLVRAEEEAEAVNFRKDVNATEFRRDMFTMLDAALRGNPVEVTYKGQAVRIVPKKMPKRMTRLELVKAAPLLGGESLPVQDLCGLSKDWEAAWDGKWDKRSK